MHRMTQGYVALVECMSLTAEADLTAANLTLAEAIAAATGTTTAEDVAVLITARDAAQTDVNTAQKALDDANEALPVGLAAAQTTLTDAQTAYDEARMRSPGNRGSDLGRR